MSTWPALYLVLLGSANHLVQLIDVLRHRIDFVRTVVLKPLEVLHLEVKLLDLRRQVLLVALESVVLLVVVQHVGNVALAELLNFLLLALHARL